MIENRSVTGANARRWNSNPRIRNTGSRIDQTFPPSDVTTSDDQRPNELITKL